MKLMERIRNIANKCALFDRLICSIRKFDNGKRIIDIYGITQIDDEEIENQVFSLRYKDNEVFENEKLCLISLFGKRAIWV